jgi:hypothetical protein
MVDTDEWYMNDVAGGNVDKKVVASVLKSYVSDSPTLVTPVLGTPASGTLTNCTGLPAAGVVGTAAILGANSFTADQDVDGNISISSTNMLELGGAGSDSGFFENSANVVYLKLGGTDSFQFNGGTTPTLRIDAGSSVYYDIGRVTSSGYLQFTGSQNSNSGYNWSTEESSVETMQMTLLNNGNLIMRDGSNLYLDGTDGTNRLNVGDTYLAHIAADDTQWVVGGQTGIRLTESGTEVDVICGAGNALATNATVGFLYVPSCAGTPTGTPLGKTGKIPIVVDSTNHKMYFYSGGSWRDAGP